MGANPNGCAIGILTLNEVDNCISVSTNQILCSIEIAIGFLVLALLVREIRRVFFLLQAMLVCYSIQTSCLMVVCAISIAQVDHTTEATYVMWCATHIIFSFAVSCRLFVLAKVVYMSGSIDRNRASNAWKIAALLFGVASTVSFVLAILWMFTPLYAPPGTVEFEGFHRAGFILFGLYVLGFGILLASVSRYVIKLYLGLTADADPSDLRKRKSGAAILRQLTISSVSSMFLLAALYMILGGVAGALRNECVHFVFWLSDFATLSTLPFVRKTAAIRAQHQAPEREVRDTRQSSRGTVSSGGGTRVSSHDKPSFARLPDIETSATTPAANSSPQSSSSSSSSTAAPTTSDAIAASSLEASVVVPVATTTPDPLQEEQQERAENLV